MTTLLFRVIDRKYMEEALAAYYWQQPLTVQEGFLRAYRVPVPATEPEIRAAISTVIANLVDAELNALAQHVVGLPA